MTRINLIPVSELHSKHLVAEYKELPRVFGLVRRVQETNRLDWFRHQPSSFRLGKGHVLFFYDKLQFLLDRQKLLIAEMQRRGMKPQHTDPDQLAIGLSPIWFNKWTPNKRDIALSRSRIEERIASW